MVWKTIYLSILCHLVGKLLGVFFQRQTPWTSGVFLAFIMFVFTILKGPTLATLMREIQVSWFFLFETKLSATSISHVFLPNKNSPISNAHFLRTAQKIDRSQHIHQQTSCHGTWFRLTRRCPYCLCFHSKRCDNDRQLHQHPFPSEAM